MEWAQRREEGKPCRRDLTHSSAWTRMECKNCCLVCVWKSERSKGLRKGNYKSWGPAVPKAHPYGSWDLSAWHCCHPPVRTTRIHCLWARFSWFQWDPASGQVDPGLPTVVRWLLSDRDVCQWAALWASWLRGHVWTHNSTLSEGGPTSSVGGKLALSKERWREGKKGEFRETLKGEKGGDRMKQVQNCH